MRKQQFAYVALLALFVTLTGGLLLVTYRPTAAANAPAVPPDDPEDWSGYNRNLQSQRFSELDEINRDNVAQLAEICVYDLGIDTSFQTGPLVIDGILYGTTEKETFAIDAENCEEKWRVREEVPDSILKVNRGLAYLDDRLYRGLQDGRVVAYETADGKKVWEVKIADAANGESVPAAPIAWEGMVFIGQAGGDNYGVKGRMYALDAETGRQLWEVYLVPREEDRKAPTIAMHRISVKTWGNPPNIPIGGGATWTSYTLDPETGLLYIPGGNPAPDFVKDVRTGENLFTNSVVVLDARSGEYRRHYSLVPEDFHDWDVAATPSLITTRAGRHLMLVAPKDGHVYGYDLKDHSQLYKTVIATRVNTDTPLTMEGTRFCPGTQGGTEWNGPAYSPETNLVYTGTVDWCTTVRIADPSKVANAAAGQPWTGSADDKNVFGQMDPPDMWSGWIIGTDADTGQIRWRFNTPAPILAALTPTAGDVVFSGDMSGKAYALDAETGKVLWQRAIEGSLGGGVVTYEVDGDQRVAFVAGTNSPVWPVEKKTAKIVVFGLR